LSDITDLSTLTLDWNNITNKPSAFPSDWTQISNKPSSFTPSSHSHLLSDITDLSTLTLDWNNITNKPSTFPSDWTTTINKPTIFPSDWSQISNKPSTFTPSPHTHTLSGITDFPTGTNGDVFVHNGTKWQANDVITIRNISWFQANANNVLRKNTIVYLQEDPNCYKVGDGITTLKNLKWHINRNYGDVSISGYNGIFGKNTSTGKDITYSIFGQSYINTATTTASNEFMGSFGFLPEPMTIEQLGINITAHNTKGGSVQLELAIYQPNFATRQNTLIAKTNLSPIVVGINFFPLQSAVTLPSGVYFFALRYVVPSGSSFQYQIINHHNQIGYIADNLYLNGSYLLSVQTSIPTTCGFPAISIASAYYLLISGQRILPTI
jgi:hypothetical protein